MADRFLAVFEPTIDEYMEVYRLSLTPTYTSERLKISLGLVFSALGAACLYFGLGSDTPVRMGLSCFSTVLFMSVWNWLYPKVQEHFIRHWYLEYLEALVDRTVEVEVTAEGLHYFVGRVRTIIDWVLIERIAETIDTAYFVYYSGGCLAVRKRAFPSRTEEDQFLNAAHQYIQAAKTNSTSAPSVRTETAVHARLDIKPEAPASGGKVEDSRNH